METIFSEKATSIYVKFDNWDDFSKISIGADFSREIGHRGRFLRRNRPQAFWGRFLQGPISPAFRPPFTYVSRTFLFETEMLFEDCFSSFTRRCEFTGPHRVSFSCYWLSILCILDLDSLWRTFPVISRIGGFAPLLVRTSTVSVRLKLRSFQDTSLLGS